MDKSPGAPSFKKPMNEESSIKKVIAVMSGKGGVGKSSVSSLISLILSRDGYKVGILDADVTGPSIMKIFGLEGQRASATPKGAVPLESRGGIKIMSVQAVLEKSEEAVIWRGPLVSGLIQQFWTDVLWGELDYLIIDMPPGTSDVPLTVMQSLPLDGVVAVTSPQELVELVVKKSISMAKSMKTRGIGMIENMSYMVCSHCGTRMEPFGESRVDSVAGEMGIEVLGKLPIDREFVSACDDGVIEDYNGELTRILEKVYKIL
jgi:Mrp family chromosome partitioning ATPase